MREILCKAKRLDNGEWAEGYLLKDDVTGQLFIHAKGNSVNESDKVNEEGCLQFVAFEINPDTICQYTGLTDKNGKKIWENDIVKYHFGDDVATIKYGEYQSCFDSQKACHVGFYVDWKKGFLRKDLGYWVKMIDCNIIGNEIDNPELLEVGV